MNIQQCFHFQRWLESLMSFRVYSDTVMVNHRVSEVIMANRDPRHQYNLLMCAGGIPRVYPEFSSIDFDLCFTNCLNSSVVDDGFGWNIYFSYLIFKIKRRARGCNLSTKSNGWVFNDPTHILWLMPGNTSAPLCFIAMFNMLKEYCLSLNELIFQQVLK